MLRESHIVKQFYGMRDLCEAPRSRACISMNCRCGRVVKRKWLETQIRRHFSDDRMYFITICLPRDECEEYDILDFDVAKSGRYIRRKLNKLRIPGFRAIFFLDVEHTISLDRSLPKSEGWSLHWHGVCKSDMRTKDLKRKIYSDFNGGAGKRIAHITKITKRPFNHTYLIKHVDEHFKRISTTSEGRLRPKQKVNGSFRDTLYEFYQKREIKNSLLLVGFRRTSGSLISIIRPYDNHLAIN